MLFGAVTGIGEQTVLCYELLDSCLELEDLHTLASTHAVWPCWRSWRAKLALAQPILEKPNVLETVKRRRQGCDADKGQWQNKETRAMQNKLCKGQVEPANDHDSTCKHFGKRRQAGRQSEKSPDAGGMQSFAAVGRSLAGGVEKSRGWAV